MIRVKAIVIIELVDHDGRVTTAMSQKEDAAASIDDVNGAYGAYQNAGHQAWRQIRLRNGLIDSVFLSEEERKIYRGKDEVPE